MARYLEVWRHTDNEGDVLTAEGVRAAVHLGERLPGPYHLAVSTGAQRATQTIACLLAGFAGHVGGGVVVEPRLRSADEDRWRRIASRARGKTLADFRDVDPEFVDGEAATLAEGLVAVLQELGDDTHALVMGHSPTNEAAVYGLTGELVEPIGKGEGLLLTAEDSRYRLRPLA